MDTTGTFMPYGGNRGHVSQRPAWIPSKDWGKLSRQKRQQIMRGEGARDEAREDADYTSDPITGGASG
ncbi:MAG: hypothetical protein QGG01_03175, partial [Roseibacillus sp.]|nr:hypothetical protein [Roseibacillus sp.]